MDVREAVCNLPVLVSGEFHVLIRAYEPEYEPRRNGKLPPRRIMHHMRGGKLIPLPASSQFATARRENVLHPFRLAAVGECDDEAARRSKNIYWRPVDPT
jgi:hypothetical protein